MEARRDIAEHLVTHACDRLRQGRRRFGCWTPGGPTHTGKRIGFSIGMMCKALGHCTFCASVRCAVPPGLQQRCGRRIGGCRFSNSGAFMCVSADVGTHSNKCLGRRSTVLQRSLCGMLNNVWSLRQRCLHLGAQALLRRDLYLGLFTCLGSRATPV